MTDEPKSCGAGMSLERYDWLMEQGHDYALAKSETDAGWHFCHTAWDGLLIHPMDLEYACCECESQQHHKRTKAYYKELQEYRDWMYNNGKGRNYPEDMKKFRNPLDTTPTV